MDVTLSNGTAQAMKVIEANPAFDTAGSTP